LTTSLGIAHHAREGDHLDESLVEVSMTLLRFLSMALLPVVAACGIIDHRVDPGPLPPIDQQDWVIYDDAPRRGTPVTSPSPRGTVDGQWEPYRRTVRTGNWKGNSAWRYPPKVRDTRASTSGETNRQWAERWVGPAEKDAFHQALLAAAAGREGPAEKDAFHQALLAAAAGREGRWTSSDGGVGIATPARIVGGCRVVEVMLTNDGGLPIRSRGTVTECP